MSLALKTLVYDWRRFLPAVVAVAFSGLLVLLHLSTVMPEAPAALAEFFRGAFSPDARSRPSTAEALRLRLERLRDALATSPLLPAPN